MQLNPLLRFYIFLIAILYIINIGTWQEMVIPGMMISGVALLAGNKLWRKVKSYFLFLPVMALFYFFISWGLVRNPMSDVLTQEILIITKFTGLLVCSGLYSIYGASQHFLAAARTLWSRLGFSWRWVEDSFVFMALVLRFFPTVQREWTQTRELQESLGLVSHHTLTARIKEISATLPGILLQQFNRAEEIARLMTIRGYGISLPRTVAFPVSWTWKDSMIFGFITILAGLIHNVPAV